MSKRVADSSDDDTVMPGAVPASVADGTPIFCTMTRGDLIHVLSITKDGTPGVKPNKYAAYFVYSPQLEQSVCAACFRPPDAHQEAVPAVPAPSPAGQCPFTNEQLVALLPGCSFGGNEKKFAHHFTRADQLAAGGHLGPVICTRCNQPIGAHRSDPHAARADQPASASAAKKASANVDAQPTRGGAIQIRTYNQVNNIVDPEENNPLPQGLKIGETEDVRTECMLFPLLIVAIVWLVISVGIWIGFAASGLLGHRDKTVFVGPCVPMAVAMLLGCFVKFETVVVHKDPSVQRELWVVEYKARRAVTLCIPLAYECTTVGKIMQVTVDQTAWRVNKRAWYEVRAHTADGKSFPLCGGYMGDCSSQARKWMGYLGMELPS